MRIAINTRLLLKNKLEGIGWFTYETLKRITTQHPEHEFIFFFDRAYDKEFVFADNVTPVIINPPARHPILWFLFFEFGITKALKKYNADIFLSPDGWLSLRTNVKSFAVIHDLNFEHYPEFIKPVVRHYYNYFFHRFAQKATKLATVSEYTKQDIVSHYGISPDLIDVVYNGSHDLYKPIEEYEKEEVRKQFTNACPYFIFIGALHQRKNIANLFKAFDAFKDMNNSLTKLMIVGNKKWWKGEMEDTYNAMKHKDEVIFTGWQAPDILNKLLASALALTYVSYFEGFGIPIVEAFNTETAIITSNVTSMPEIAGDAALLVDPFDISSIADAMYKLDTDETFRKQLIEKGNARKHLYSWDKTAAKLWEAIEKTIKQ